MVAICTRMKRVVVIIDVMMVEMGTFDVELAEDGSTMDTTQKDNLSRN